MFAPIFTGGLSDIVPLYLNTKVKICTELLVGDKKRSSKLISTLSTLFCKLLCRRNYFRINLKTAAN